MDQYLQDRSLWLTDRFNSDILNDAKSVERKILSDV
jgi:hypothetical protein